MARAKREKVSSSDILALAKGIKVFSGRKNGSSSISVQRFLRIESDLDE